MTPTPPSLSYLGPRLSEALLLLLDRLGERAIYMCEVVNDDLTFARVPQTAWLKLVDLELVSVRVDIGCFRYQLTGSGWREALKLAGRLDAPEFQERFGRLNRVLEDLVKGGSGEILAATQDVAAQAGIPEEWLYNTLESAVWQSEHGRRGAALDDSKTMVVAPRDFNMPLAPVRGPSNDHAKHRFAGIKSLLGRSGRVPVRPA